MTELLENVNKSIEAAEGYKRNRPDYYDAHWRMHHELLLQVKKELENNGKAAHKECIDCNCADNSVNYSDWWYCKNPEDFRDFDVIRDGLQKPKWCKRW